MYPITGLVNHLGGFRFAESTLDNICEYFDLLILLSFTVPVLEDEIVPVHGILDVPRLIRDDPINADPDGQEDMFNAHKEQNPVASSCVWEESLKFWRIEK